MVYNLTSVVYIAENISEEPDFQFIPDCGPAIPATAMGANGDDLLARSLHQLEDGLTSGTIMTQFEVLQLIGRVFNSIRGVCAEADELYFGKLLLMTVLSISMNVDHMSVAVAQLENSQVQLIALR